MSLAARKHKKKIGKEDLEEAMIKVVAGPEKKTRIMSDKAKKLTAYHEAGHALITRLTPNQDPVHQISIIPRGRTGGYTMSLPSEDKFYTSRQEMLSQITVLLGGRVAEHLVLDDISTGASNDLDRATAIARQMVTKYGMSEKLGPMTFGSVSDEVFLGKDFSHTQNYSELVASEIDGEIRKIINDCFNECKGRLSENIDKLHEIASLLLEKEKLDGEEFEALFKDIQTEQTEDSQE